MPAWVRSPLPPLSRGSRHRKVGRAVRHSLGMRRSGRETSVGSTPSPSAGGFGMGTPSRLESGGPHRVWGFDSLTLRSRSHVSRTWKEGHLVWRAASKAVGARPQVGSIPPPSALRGKPSGRAAVCNTAASRVQVRILPHGLPGEAVRPPRVECRDRFRSPAALDGCEPTPRDDHDSRRTLAGL